MRSMTAFARAEAAFGRGRMVVEIRSVNHRHLQPGLRLPRECAALEPRWRARLQATCRRGKIDVNASFRAAPGAADAPRLNRTALRRLLALRRRLPAERGALLANPALWQARSGPDEASLAAHADAAFEQALAEFLQQRESEGRRLAEALAAQLRETAELAAAVRARRPEIQRRLHEGYRARLRELDAGADEKRVAEELALQTMRADVDEELTRLDSHVAETRAALAAEGAQGRKLDFLMQEFMREANTLGTKAPDPETTRDALALKVLTEQMREQIQNLE